MSSWKLGGRERKEVLLRMHFLLCWLLCLHVGGASLLYSTDLKATSPSPAQSQPFSIAPVLEQTCSECLAPKWCWKWKQLCSEGGKNPHGVVKVWFCWVPIWAAPLVNIDSVIPRNGRLAWQCGFLLPQNEFKSQCLPTVVLACLICGWFFQACAS